LVIQAASREVCGLSFLRSTPAFLLGEPRDRTY